MEHDYREDLPVPLLDMPVTEDQLYVIHLALQHLNKKVRNGDPVLFDSHISGNDPADFVGRLVTKTNALHQLMKNGIPVETVIVDDTTPRDFEASFSSYFKGAGI